MGVLWRSRLVQNVSAAFSSQFDWISVVIFTRFGCRPIANDLRDEYLIPYLAWDWSSTWGTGGCCEAGPLLLAAQMENIV